jgi:hypothetical protein
MERKVNGAKGMTMGFTDAMRAVITGSLRSEQEAGIRRGSEIVHPCAASKPETETLMFKATKDPKPTPMTRPRQRLVAIIGDLNLKPIKPHGVQLRLFHRKLASVLCARRFPGSFNACTSTFGFRIAPRWRAEGWLVGRAR